jgi:hypothetical protein
MKGLGMLSIGRGNGMEAILQYIWGQLWISWEEWFDQGQSLIIDTPFLSFLGFLNSLV